MADLPEAADPPDRGRLHVLGVRIQEDDVPVRCMVVAAVREGNPMVPAPEMPMTWNGGGR